MTLYGIWHPPNEKLVWVTVENTWLLRHQLRRMGWTFICFADRSINARKENQ